MIDNKDIARSLADMMIEWFAGPEPNDAGDLAHVIEKRLARFAPPAAEAPGQEPVEDIVYFPPEISDRLIALGPVEWGHSGAKSDAELVAEFAETLRLTREFSHLEGDQDLQTVYVEGTGLVVCHTGTSPNSALHARIIVGLINHARGLVSAPPTYADAEAKEKAVKACPQCDGEGAYADGLDDAACSTSCTRCDGNGWIVDVTAIRSLASPAPKEPGQ